MNEWGAQKRLSAILIADVVGYTRLVERDRDGTVAAWRSAKENVIDPAISKHSGKIVKHTGDGFLAEFPTVENCVECAVGMQRDLAESALDFRMAANLGDIVDDGEDIHGEGVNIAARMEALAPDGGICISGSVFDQVRNQLRYQYEDLGEHVVKNVSAPVRVYRIDLGPDPVSAPHLPTSAAGPVADSEQDKPSIAVLPFDNMSSDPEHDYLADGLVEDILTGLSHQRWLTVIARNSSFAYKGQQLDLKQVGRELEVRYLLEGSVRASGKRIRVTAQLIEAATNDHLWANKYDREIDDIFALQDELTAAILGAIEPELGAAERRRAHKQPAGSLSAWAQYQMGVEALFHFDKEGHDRALEHFERAVEIDPQFAPAYAQAAYAHMYNALMGLVDDREAELDEALRLGTKAVGLDDRDAIAHFALGRTYGTRGDFAAAEIELRTALEINPNSAQAHHGLGFVQCFSGQYEAALESFDRAIRLSPQDPHRWAFYVLKAYSFLQLNRFEEAAEMARQSIRSPHSQIWARIYLAAALGHMNRRDEAKPVFDDIYRMNKEFSETFVHEVQHFDSGPGAMDFLLEGLRKAGLENSSAGATHA